MISIHELTESGLDPLTAKKLFADIEAILKNESSLDLCWQAIAARLSQNQFPFAIHLAIFTALFPDWRQHPETAPACIPNHDVIANANITKFMQEVNMTDLHAFHRWSYTAYQEFWARITEKLSIVFTKKSDQVCDLSKGIEAPNWFPGAELNISDSCFNANPNATALITQREQTLVKMTFAELNNLANQIANSLCQLGLKKSDAIAIIMPMHSDAIAAYLAIIKMGGIVVSVADSFTSNEIAVRLRIANTKAVITQDFLTWGDKQIPLYEKITQATTAKLIVIGDQPIQLRENDIRWKNFLVENTHFTSVPCEPMAACNILFSSGTTAEPKAIVWNHTTFIKAASDAFFHQNIKPNDVLAWPTNLGWMMGPWLIVAALINRAAIALYTDAPKGRAFGEFIQNAGVTMLGIVPTLVANWRQSKCMEGLDWSAIKVFSSSGECSNAEDMFYLMHLANYKPVIEYCGGTEIGGAYISSTVIENNYPAIFTTPTMGLHFKILDEAGHEAKLGEVAIVPPSIGLSTTLLNADHHHVYFENMPKTSEGFVLRRHGDQIKQLANGYYCILGRVDDTMNLGGIKISSAEIERVLAGIPDVIEVAAIAMPPPDNGPNQLIIYAATTAQLDKKNILRHMQERINQQLNPLFKIHDVVFVESLPKTASNKIMRRLLRK